MQLLLFAKTTIWFCCVLVPGDICIAPISIALLGLFYSICTARKHKVNKVNTFIVKL